MMMFILSVFAVFVVKASLEGRSRAEARELAEFYLRGREAPMKIITLKKKKAGWITEEILENRRYRERLGAKARRSKEEQDLQEWKNVRKKVAKLVKEGKKKYLQQGLNDQLSNSASAWRGIKAHLGWDSQVGPEALIIKITEGKSKLEKLVNKPSEVAEEMVKQYKAKNEEVKEAIGQPAADYLTRVRKLTAGNCGRFDFNEVTEKEVREAIQKVDDKESFGADNISYGCLKKLIQYVTKPLTEIINMSIKISKYPRCWKMARVKPIWKGKGNNKSEAKSYRPVALLPACGRIMEGLLAKQVNKYAQERNILHDSVHGFREGHGTDTALAEVWEFVLGEVEKGNIVALCLLDVSAGFDSVPHINLLRKLEMYGYGDKTLKWLASYLERRKQFVVVEDEESRVYSLDRGIPQGGPLCPDMWREYVNDLPEEVMKWGGSLEGADGADWPSQHTQATESPLSRMVDQKAEENCTPEELFDRKMRKKNGVLNAELWRIKEYRQERTGVGPDQLRAKKRRDPDDGKSTIYADDSSILSSGTTWKQLESRMHSSLRPTFDNMKASRLKVNENKTQFIVIASHQRRLASGGLKVETSIGGEAKKPEEVVKSLGVLISNDLTWKHQTKSKLEECQNKLRGLYSIQKQVPLERRKELATGVICSRLGYALETVSTGRMKDLEALQSMKVKAARWVLGARKFGWSTSKNFQKLGWLTVQQEVTYKSVRMALKVLQAQQPRFLHERITTPRMVSRAGEWHEVRFRRRMTAEELSKMKLSTRKSWAVRATRWMEQIPEHLLTTCVKKKSAKKELKDWCMTNIPTTGDRILRGKILVDTSKNKTEKGHEDENKRDEEKLKPKGQQQKFMQNWIHGQQQNRDGKSAQCQESHQQRGGESEHRHWQGGGKELVGPQGQEEELETHQESGKRGSEEAGCRSQRCKLKIWKDYSMLLAPLVMGGEDVEVKTRLATYLTMLLLLAMNVEVELSQGEEVVKASSLKYLEDPQKWEDGMREHIGAEIEEASRTGVG